MFIYSESDNGGAFKNEIIINTIYKCSDCNYEIKRVN